MTPQPMDPNRPPFHRNTAPLWKKITIVLSAAVAVGILAPSLHTSHLSALAVAGIIIVVVAAVVWLVARLLGVRLSLRSWD